MTEGIKMEKGDIFGSVFGTFAESVYLGFILVVGGIGCAAWVTGNTIVGYTSVAALGVLVYLSLYISEMGRTNV